MMLATNREVVLNNYIIIWIRMCQQHVCGKTGIGSAILYTSCM